MEALRKAYVLVLSIALLVLIIARPPASWIGWLAVGATLVSLVAMVLYTTGVQGVAGPAWFGWLGLQVLSDAIALWKETDAIWHSVGWDWGMLAMAGSGVLFLPLYIALYRLGRGRVAG